MKIYKSLDSFANDLNRREDALELLANIGQGILMLVFFPITILWLLNTRYHWTTKIQRFIWKKTYSLKKVEGILRKDILWRVDSAHYVVYCDESSCDDSCWIENSWVSVKNYLYDVRCFRATDKEHFWLSMASTEEITEILRSITFKDVYSRYVSTCVSCRIGNAPLAKIHVMLFSTEPISQDEYYYTEK